MYMMRWSWSRMPCGLHSHYGVKPFSAGFWVTQHCQLFELTDIRTVASTSLNCKQIPLSPLSPRDLKGLSQGSPPDPSSVPLAVLRFWVWHLDVEWRMMRRPLREPHRGRRSGHLWERDRDRERVLGFIWGFCSPHKGKENLQNPENCDD
jgi:hypothetical protein